MGNDGVNDTGVLTFAAAGTYTIEHTYTGSGATATTGWSGLTQAEAQGGISKVDDAIKSLAKSIQSVGDSNARLSSKEESLSLAISNTEATRSRIEDADFAKEQMSMMKLQILQQTTISSFAQANAAKSLIAMGTAVEGTAQVATEEDVPTPVPSGVTPVHVRENLWKVRHTGKQTPKTIRTRKTQAGLKTQASFFQPLDPDDD